MKLVSINIGQEKTLQNKGRAEQTGIFKLPSSDPAKIARLGLDGDVIISKKHHGGPDQAIYVYGTADYEWWAKELGREILPGTFGDNLTISSLESAQFNIGDYLHFGEVTLQITAPRIPCGTFAARMEDSHWVKKFRQAERPGLYCRVLKEGTVKTGEVVSFEKYMGATISIVEVFRDYYENNKSEETIQRHLRAPVAIRVRLSLEKELESLLAARAANE